jgi:hypothetical protein
MSPWKTPAGVIVWTSKALQVAVQQHVRVGEIIENLAGKEFHEQDVKWHQESIYLLQ